MARILIVDRDRMLCRVLGTALKRRGHECLVAHEGGAALQMVHSDSLDLIVLAVALPDMDGIEVCRRIRSTPQTAQLPVLMLTSLKMRLDREAGLRAGANAYISKPIVVKEAMGHVESLLRKPKTLDTTPILAFIGAKGGVGTTTISLNVGVCLALSGERTILLDHGSLDPTAAWTLGLEPKADLLNVATVKGPHYTAVDLQRCVLSHVSGLDYLAVRGREIRESESYRNAIKNTLRMLRGLYDIIIADVAVSAIGMRLRVLRHASSIIPVVEHDAVCLLQLQSLLSWLKDSDLLPLVPGIVLVQRYQGPALEPRQLVGEALGHEILSTIPSASTELHHANFAQQPLILASPTSPACYAITALAHRLAAQIR